MADKKKSLEDTIAEELNRLNLSPDEAKNVLRQLSRPERARKTFDHYNGSKKSRFMVVSDTHIGSKFYRPDIMDAAAKMAKQHDVDAIYHAGDVIEGMSGRDGHIYELQDIGVSAQMDRAVSELEKLTATGKPLYFTTGNHDEWAKTKANQGHLVGPDIEARLKGSKFLGEYTAQIALSPTVNLWLTHEGASSYALSYSGQKRINSLAGGSKPDIVFNGHIHKSLYMFYRNIHYFEAGTMQDQTPFMAMKGSPAMTGFWIAEVSHNKKGVNGLTSKFFPFYG